MLKAFRRLLTLSLLLSVARSPVAAHDVIFCGEAIPMSYDFVAHRLMNIIKRQIPNVNMAGLRQRANLYFPYIEAALLKAKMPTDFKYLPVVESGFQNLTSRVGAGGIWQIMPSTARGHGMRVDGGQDDRTNFNAATDVALRELIFNYNELYKRFQVRSWVLATAAYNFGIGNISKIARSQGTNYFTMQMNQETSEYVYKIIAVKELFEYPELYMKDFGYNIFATNARKPAASGTQDVSAFKSMQVKVGAKGSAVQEVKTSYVPGKIKGRYKDFQDGDFVDIVLDGDLNTSGGFTARGNTVRGPGYLIDGRIMVDLGYGHDVILCDADLAKGVDPGQLKNKCLVMLKNNITDEHLLWK